MRLIATVLVSLVAVEHVWILVLEMFLWRTPTGRRAFHLTPERAEATAALAKNQGLYNGFLAAGLAFGLLAPDPLGFPLRVFFLCCVAVAGTFGAATVQRSIFFIQALPALLALVATWLSA